MAGKFALIIGNGHYEDSSLGRLTAPDVDVEGLAGVLKAADIGQFDEVTTLLNEDFASVRKAVARFYDQRQRDDLLFLYFSGHGVKDEQGHLYLALRDTESTLLAGTAIETAFITGRMDRSFSKRQVLVLDCCHSGAFAYGAKAAQGVSVGTAEAFEGTGLGRVILTATDSTQYAWEGDRIIGNAQNSLFTHFLIDGLKTGAADRDDDGVVTVDELYDYVREQVVNTTPRQTPYKWTYRQQGEIILAQNPLVKRSTLPPEIEEATNSKLSSLRLEAVRDLKTLLRGHHVGRARAALAALKDLSHDDSRKVANAAVEALGVYAEEERRRQVGPHLTAARAAIERKQFEQALESLRQASQLDAQAEGLAELVRIAEKGKAAEEIEGKLAAASPCLARQDLPGAMTLVEAALRLDPQHAAAAALHAQIQQAVEIAARTAIEQKRYGEALDLLREVPAAGFTQFIRIAEAGKVVGEIEGKLAEASQCLARQDLPEAMALVEAALRLDPQRAATRALYAEIQQAVAAEEIRRPAESPATADDRIEGQPSDIFISYAREDREKARALANVLTARGWNVWWDRKIAPGEAFDVVIERELGACKCAIVLWSADSVNATWVRNEARRASRRRVLVPILIDQVETPLEFENLQAADLTSWEAAAEHPELEAVFERIQALAPIPYESLARAAVEDARREFGAGRRQAALARLEQFRPAHDLVTRALTELRAQAERIKRRDEDDRRKAEPAQRQLELGTEKARIEELLGRSELDAAERALAAAEKKFETSAEFRPLPQRLTGLRGLAQHEQLARKAVEDARREFAAGWRDAALARLEQFRPAHHLVTRALTELRAEADRIERERAEPARREAEAAQRQRELGAEKARIEELLGRGELDAAEQALATAGKNFKPSAEFRPLREQLDTLRGQAQHERRARNAVEDARREFGAGRREAALASLEQFRPAHDLVSRALTELRAEADRIERERAEAARREAEAHGRERRAADEARAVAQAQAEARAREEQERAQQRQEQLAREQQERERRQALAAASAATLAHRVEQPKESVAEEVGTTAPPPQPSRTIYIAGGAAVVLLLTVGTWWGMKPNSAPAPPASQGQVSQPPGASLPQGPGQARNPGGNVTPKVPDNLGQPTEAEQPPPGALPEIPVTPDKSAESPAIRQAPPSGRLEELRTQARKQSQSGQRELALNTVVQGLQIDPKDSFLRNIQDSLLRDAQGGAARSKHDAMDLDASARAEEAFDRGLKKEREAVGLRRTGRIDAATRSFWLAADQFRAAAEESRQIEADEQARIRVTPPAQPPKANLADRKPPNPDLEKEVVIQTLRRYEAAYANLSADGVRSVYPSAPIDQLAKDFADYRSYTLKVEIDEFKFYVFSETRTSVVVTGRVIHDFLTKSGRRTQFERSQITLEKQGTTWIIVQIR